MFNSVFLRCWTLACLSAVLLTSPAHAQANLSKAGKSEEPKASLDVGFSGAVKLGHWVPVTLRVPASITNIDSAATLEIAAIDGDESPVVYSTPAVNDDINGNRRRFNGLFRLGRRYGKLTATVRSADEQEIFSTTIDLANADLKLGSATESLSVILSTNDAFAAQIRKTLGAGAEPLPQDQARRAVQVSNFELLPSDELGWQSVNQIIMALPSASSIANLSDQQWTALRQWVGNGGRLVLITDPAKPELVTETPLQRILPPVSAQSKTMTSSRPLERLVGTSRRRLIVRGENGIEFTQFTQPLPATTPVVLLTEDKSPVMFRLAEGFGQISVIAIDLESPRIADWPSYSTLLEKILLNDSSDRRSGQAQRLNEAKRAGTALTHYGYDDMSGQLRVPLDDFSTVRFVDFTLIAVLIGAYILLVSLGDYFFLKRFIKRMEMTWISFPLLALSFCGIAWGIALLTRPNELQINQMEIIDITPNQAYSHGTSWINIYSPAGQKIDVSLNPKTALGLDLTRSAVTWQGLPGDGLGGMQTTTTTGFKRTGYRQNVPAVTPTLPAADVNSPTTASPNFTLEQLPLQVSSTRSLVSHYQIKSPASVSSQLAVRRDRLQGTFKNPLDVPIYNGKVFFGNYVYLLKKTLQPDEVVFMETGADEKTIRTYLNRQSSKGQSGNDAGKTQNLPWNPRDKSLTRIADVMMFFEAAGGKTYTGLSHGYFPQIDATALLQMNQAVLVGQLLAGSQLTIDGRDTDNLYDSSVTMVRVVLPVEDQ